MEIMLVFESTPQLPGGSLRGVRRSVRVGGMCPLFGVISLIERSKVRSCWVEVVLGTRHSISMAVATLLQEPYLFILSCRGLGVGEPFALLAKVTELVVFWFGTSLWTYCILGPVHGDPLAYHGLRYLRVFMAGIVDIIVFITVCSIFSSGVDITCGFGQAAANAWLKASIPPSTWLVIIF